MFEIEFYMDEEVANPDRDVFDALVQTIKDAERTPRREYFIFLNDYYIDKRLGIGKNTLKISGSHPLIK